MPLDDFDYDENEKEEGLEIYGFKFHPNYDIELEKDECCVVFRKNAEIEIHVNPESFDQLDKALDDIELEDIQNVPPSILAAGGVIDMFMKYSFMSRPKNIIFSEENN